MANSQLDLSRSQILAFRRKVGMLDNRQPLTEKTLRRAAWAGLQDSMPRAALLSIHARLAGTEPTTLDDPSLVQVWGPRYSVYVIARTDLAAFTLGRLPEHGAGRRRALEVAAALRDHLGESTMRYDDVGQALGVNPNRLRYAAPTGTVLLRWEGARRPTIRVVPPPEVDPTEARLELARRYLHVFGPATSGSFADWAGVTQQSASARFDALSEELIEVRTPIGDASILATDEQVIRTDPPATTSARLLPSGDTYFLLQGDPRELLVPDASRRDLLWTPRVWPGAVLHHGEIVGVWRRSHEKVTVHVWERLDNRARKAIELEAASLPLPNLEGEIVVEWGD
jgi:hypothetical protein